MNRLQASARRVMVTMIANAGEISAQEFTTRNGGRFVRVRILPTGDIAMVKAEWSTNEGRIEFSKAQQLIEEMLMAKRVRDVEVHRVCHGYTADIIGFDESLGCAKRGGDFDPAELAAHVGNQEVTK